MEVSDENTQGERLFVRFARGDGSGIITMPDDMQENARAIVLDHWTAWSLAYLWQCGKHHDELIHVAWSLREVLAKWWDAHNSFCEVSSGARFYPEEKQWNAFWKPSTAAVHDPDHNRDASIYKQGWDDAVLEMTRQQAAKPPNICERISSIFRRKARSHDPS
jgi:hypothetical protein